MRNSIDSLHTYEWASQIALVVKKLPANTGKTKDMGVQSLGWGDPLQEGMATHSSILAWRIHIDRRAWQTTVHRVRVGHDRSNLAHNLVLYVFLFKDVLFNTLC